MSQDQLPEDRSVRSAYGESESYDYDSSRFTSPAGRLFHQIEVAQLEGALNLMSKQSRVLEVGSGTGRFFDTVLGRQHNLTCIEPSEYMIKASRANNERDLDVHYVRGEAAQLPFSDDAFDLVYTIRVLNQLESADYAFGAILEMMRVLKPTGLALIEFCNSRRPIRGAGVRLNPLAVRELIRGRFPASQCVASNGILFLSQTLLNAVPTGLLGYFELVDGALSRRFPEYSARCYLTFRKAIS